MQQEHSQSPLSNGLTATNGNEGGVLDHAPAGGGDLGPVEGGGLLPDVHECFAHVIVIVAEADDEFQAIEQHAHAAGEEGQATPGGLHEAFGGLRVLLLIEELPCADDGAVRAGGPGC